jgi:signal peptidase I
MGPDVLDRPLAPVPPEPSRRRAGRELFEASCVAVIFALHVRTFLVQAFEVPSPSMEKTVLVGDRLLVNKFIFAPHNAGPLDRLLPYRPVRRGDIFVFKFPEDPERDFIKRVVALPGDLVAIRDKQLFVNEARRSEPRAFHSDDLVRADDPQLPAAYRRRDQVPLTRIPADAFFALGDNRDASHDSRFWGPVPAGNIKGRALLVYWSMPPEGQGAGGLLRRLRASFESARWERILLPVR